MAITYYMHPMKCGGSSVRRVLKELQIDYYETEELSPNENTLSLLDNCKSNDILVFGHIQDLPRPSKTDSNSASIRSKIIEILYGKCQIIMPTRHPANLVQSWMHYCKTRAVKVLSNAQQDHGKGTKRKSNDLAMLLRITSLKQDGLLLISGKIISTGKEIRLRDEDEEENIFRFTKHLLLKEKFYPPLLGLQYQLYRPIYRQIKESIYRAEKYILPEYPRIIYYDSSSPSMLFGERIGQIIHPNFLSNLKATRVNFSQDPPIRLASTMPKILNFLEHIHYGENQIFKKSTY